MSEFRDIFLNNDDENKGTTKSTTKVTEQDKKITDEVLVKIRDQELFNNEYIRYLIEIYIVSESHIWMEKSSEKSWCVYRRYSEFEEFREHLVEIYPASIIPPLPSKLNSFNPLKMTNQVNDSDFIESRRQRLEWFIKRILNHPRLMYDSKFYDFLRDGHDWRKTTVDLGASITNKMGHVINWRWWNFQSHFMDLFEDHGQIQELIKSNMIADEAKIVMDRGNQLLSMNRSLLDSLGKIDANNRILHTIYKNYGEAFYDWCGLTEQSNGAGNALQSVGQLCDSYSNLAGSHDSMQATNLVSSQQDGNFTTMSTNNAKLRSIMTWYEISLQLREFCEYGESWISLGGRLALLMKRLVRTRDYLDSLQVQLDRLNTGQPIKQGFISNLKNKLQRPPTEAELQETKANLESSICDTRQKLEVIESNQTLFLKYLEEEIRHFDEFYTREMRIVMMSYAQNQLMHSERCLRLWQRARQSIDQSE